jgi:hypothetical protein
MRGHILIKLSGVLLRNVRLEAGIKLSGINGAQPLCILQCVVATDEDALYVLGHRERHKVAESRLCLICSLGSGNLREGLLVRNLHDGVSLARKQDYFSKTLHSSCTMPSRYQASSA